MSTDNTVEVTVTAVSGPHVEIDIVDDVTGALAQQYLEQMLDEDGAPVTIQSGGAVLEEAVLDTDGGVVRRGDDQGTETDGADEISEDTDDAGDADQDDVGGPDDVPIDGREWEQPEYRDARVQAFIEAMHDHYEEPFETTASAVAEQTGDAAKGVVWSLKDLDGFAVEKAGETDEGATVWRIAPVEADEPTDEASVSDDPVDDDADSDDSEPNADVAGADELGDPKTSNVPLIEIEDRSQTRQLDANEVVDAIADEPTKHRAKAQLGLSLDAFEDLLTQLDLLERFEDAAPLPVGEVQETVATYLEVAK